MPSVGRRLVGRSTGTTASPQTAAAHQHAKESRVRVPQSHVPFLDGARHNRLAISRERHGRHRLGMPFQYLPAGGGLQVVDNDRTLQRADCQLLGSHVKVQLRERLDEIEKNGRSYGQNSFAYIGDSRVQ